MNVRQSIIPCLAIILSIASLSKNETYAVEITKTITFKTSSSAGSLVSIQGTLNTLAQGLNTVPFENTSITVQGELTANVTFELGNAQSGVEIIGFDILESSFVQQNLMLSYEVANTVRTVQFLTNGIGFSINSTSPSQQPLQTSMVDFSARSFQIQQTSGTAQIDITNRPSKQQSISQQQSVLSNYVETTPSPSQFVAGISPTSQALDGFVVDINLPLTNQQLTYSGVGLPVTLNYVGGLNLISPLITLSIPEPATGVLLVISGCALLMRRTKHG